MNLNIAILEDNTDHYIKLNNMLNEWASKNNNSVNTRWYKNGKDILEDAFIMTCNIIFSDIELKTTNKDDTFSNGIKICTALRKKGVCGDIIFLTAFREYVFDGYQAQAVSYLIKPISKSSLDSCLARYISINQPNFYYIHKDNNIIRIPYNDIISISKLGHDCCITTNSEVYNERVTLLNIEKRLPSQFIRCHRSCIINLNHIVSLSGSKIKLSNKQTQIIGRLYHEQIKTALLKIAIDSIDSDV